VVGEVDALMGSGPPVLVDCVGDLFDDLAEGCFLVWVVVFVVEVGEVCPDLLFHGGDARRNTWDYTRSVCRKMKTLKESCCEEFSSMMFNIIYVDLFVYAT